MLQCIVDVGVGILMRVCFVFLYEISSTTSIQPTPPSNILLQGTMETELHAQYVREEHFQEQVQVIQSGRN